MEGLYVEQQQKNSYEAMWKNRLINIYELESIKRFNWKFSNE